ncbi:MAG: hypothetical protein AAF533_05800 [Acidobacteriota bacterium]
MTLVRNTCLPLVALLATVNVGTAQTSLEQRLRQLTAQMEALQGEVNSLRGEMARKEAVAEKKQEEVFSMVETLTDEVERSRLGEAFGGRVGEGRYGLGPAASKVYNVDKGVAIGGYGEMLAEAFDSELDDGTRSSKKDQIDFLRAIVYFGYKFNDRIVFNSELEFEHAVAASGDTGVGSRGSVSVEFAYLDFLFKDAFNVRTGLLLAPLGHVNELHEPPVFLGARRPEVEQSLIPTTWRENGAGFFGETDLVSYRVYLMAGFDASKFSDSKPLRSGRQKGSRSRMEDLGVAGRIDFTPTPGLTVGLGAYYGHSGQDITYLGEELEVSTRMWEAHLDWRHRGTQVRALWVDGSLGDTAELNATLGKSGSDAIGEGFSGGYLEVGHDILSHRGTDQQLIPFVRWETIDSQESVEEFFADGTSTGFLRDPANDRDYWTYGISYLPHPQVAIKAEYRNEDNDAGTGQDQFNIAVGFNY